MKARMENEGKTAVMNWCKLFDNTPQAYRMETAVMLSSR
jgi:hypothetical protein